MTHDDRSNSRDCVIAAAGCVISAAAYNVAHSTSSGSTVGIVGVTDIEIIASVGGVVGVASGTRIAADLGVEGVVGIQDIERIVGVRNSPEKRPR
jgi:hypothetical protein